MADIRLKGSAGPVGNSKIANKTLRSKPSKLRAPSDHQREVVRVYSSVPSLEKRSYGTEKDQIYDGEVNVLLIIEGNTDMMCCKYTQDVKEIAVGFGDGSIRTFDSTTGACTHTLVDAESISYPGSVTAIKHRPISNAQPVTNTFIASYVNGSIRYWKYKCEKCLYTIREKRQTLGVSYHPRWSKFITYGDDAVLNMYDEEAQTQERAYFSKEPSSKMTSGAPRTGHTSRIFACTFHPRSNHELVSGGWDNTVMCWDDRQPHATRYFSGVHMCGEGIDFDKSGRTIITCSWQERDVIQVWDYGSAKLIGSIEPDSHPSKLFCGRLVPMTNLLVCGGSDGNILKLVDVIHHETVCAIRNNPGSVYGFDFGTIRRKTSKVERLLKRTSDIQRVPRVAFVTGKRLQIVDFG